MPKTHLLAAAAIGVGWAIWGAPASALDDPAARAVVTRLDNGLVVITLEDSSTPVVSFQMWVKVGSRDEAGYTGLAHLFEHMMFNGSKHIGPEQHANLITARGGAVNAYTSNDQTVYFDDATRETLPLVIDLEYERLAYLDISEQSLDRERQVVLEERRMRTEDQPVGRAYEAVLALLWQAHPYRWPVIGWRSDVEKATVEVCRRFFETYYAPNNIVIAIAGDFDTDETLAHLRRTFGRLPPSPEIPRNPTEEPPQRGERRATVHFEVRSPLVAAVWHAPAAGHQDASALDVLSQVLSSGRTSRLYRELVYENPVALSAAGAYWELDRAGVFYAWMVLRPDQAVEKADAMLFAEIDRVSAEGVTEEEVEKARRSLEVGLIEGMGTSHALASRVAQDWTTFGRIRPLEERLAQIRGVTAEDVRRVARTYLRPERRSVVHVVPPPEDGDAPAEAAGPAPAGAGEAS